jgi:hypothetical protein
MPPPKRKSAARIEAEQMIAKRFLSDSRADGHPCDEFACS